MKILSYVRKFIGLLILTLPLHSFAQTSIEQKVDSMRKEFFRKDSIRRMSVIDDTLKNKLFESPKMMIFSSKSSDKNVDQLFLQVIRFGHSHFLKFLYRGRIKQTAIIIKDADKLNITFDDNSTISLSFEGKVFSDSNGMKNGSDLIFEYKVPDIDYTSLLNKKVIALKVENNFGAMSFNIDGGASIQIQNACLLANQ